MITRIISGGQSGVDRAALDAAIEMGIPHGGWIPRGRLTEDGPLPEEYQLTEMESNSYYERTEKNIIESDGTLIISRGKLTGGSAQTKILVGRHNRPNLHMDLNNTAKFQAGAKIMSWIRDNRIQVLNVAGPRASKDPGIYKDAKDLLEVLFHLDTINTSLSTRGQLPRAFPKSVSEAVEHLVSIMPLKDKTIIAKMKEDELPMVDDSLGIYIINNYGLNGVNRDLLLSCRYVSQQYNLDGSSASKVIIKELWKKLLKTHVLRLVK